MPSKLRIATLAGIRLYVHWTFSLLVLWIIVTSLRSGAGGVDILWTLLFVASIFGCVVLHELGHALMARRFGIATRDITLLPIGGVASLESMPEKPSEELRVALAGPAVNVVIVLLLMPVAYALHMVPDPEQLEPVTTLHGGNFLVALISVNVILAVFNLLPAFPMDGGRVLRALLAIKLGRARATAVAALVGQVCAVGFVVLGFTSNPVLALIGVFIFVGAGAEATHTSMQAMLSGHRVREVMLRELHTIDAEDTIARAVQMLLDSQCRTFLVTDGQAPVGVLTRAAIIRALSSGSDTARVRDAMDPELSSLSPGMPLDEAFLKMQQHGKELMPVMEDGQLIGGLDQENVTEFVMIMTAKAR